MFSSITCRLILARIKSKWPIPESESFFQCEQHYSHSTAAFSRAFSILQSSESMASTESAPILQARMARTPVPVPKSRTERFLKSRCFHGCNHHIGGCMMSGSKTHFRSNHQIILYVRKWFVKMRPDHTEIINNYRFKIFFPFRIPVLGSINSF